MTARFQSDSGSDRGPVGSGSDKLECQPIVGAGPVVAIVFVAQQLRRLVHVHDEHVDVAVVVKVSESAAAAGMRRSDGGTAFSSYVLKPSVSKISEDEARTSVRVLFEVSLNFGVYPAGRDQYVPPAIVVQGNHSGSPLHITGMIESGLSRCVLKEPAAGISVEGRQVIGEMRLEDVCIAVSVVITGGDAHSGLGLAVLAVCRGRFKRDVGKGAVVV